MKFVHNVFITPVILSIFSWSMLVLPARDTVTADFVAKTHVIVSKEAIEDAVAYNVDDEIDEPIELSGKELYISYISKICQQYFPELDPAVVQAVMETESNYVPTVESRCGAVGLMQVIPKWHAWRMDKYGLTDIWDPWTNILVGMDFIDESLHKYGNYYDALFEYNHSRTYANYVLWLADDIRQGGEQNGTASSNIARGEGKPIN